VVAVSTARAAGRGLLIRDRNGFELARALDGIVFDKTGTLTEGRFSVSDVVTIGQTDEEELLGLAAAVESQSEHPIARGVVAAAEERGIDRSRPSGFRAIAGKGAEAEVEGRAVQVVSSGYLEEHDIGVERDDARTTLDELGSQGKTVVYVLVDGELAGAIALADVVREASRSAVDGLKALDIRVMMITGDSEAVARTVAGELGLDDFFAEVLPDDKAARIRELRDQGQRVAMVGDGINDAPALAEADVGVAIGAGTDVAMETADVVLVESDPRDVLEMVSLSRATYRKMVQNLWWASGYNIVAIPLAAGVAAPLGIVLPPAIGALVMSVSTVVVAINARRLGDAH
jgi:Cu2+-exporting ATPase